MNHLFRQTPLFAAILFSSLLSSVNAQHFYKLPPLNIPEIQTDFRKQLTNWRWNGKFQDRSHGDDPRGWYISESFRSNLIIPGAGEKRWNDEHRFNGNFFFGNNTLRSGLYAKSWLLNDRLISSGNRFENHILGFYSAYSPKKFFTIMPHLGYQKSRNRKKIDWGWNAGIRGEMKRYNLGDYQADLQAESEYDFYDKRQNYENQFNIGLSTHFNEYTNDSLSFSFSEVSKQYYAANSIDLLQVKMYDRLLTNRLFYRLSPRNIFSLSTRLQSRYNSYFNGRSIFFIENYLQYLHIARKYTLSFSLRTNDETQDNAATFTDNQTKRTTMDFQVNYLPDRDNRLEFNFAYVKLQYDTPDPANYDDRDEQRFVFDINYFHRFSPYLSMELLTYVYLYHQIYIFEQQSQNNNWNRVFKLNPTISYRSGRLSNKLSTQVLANYTVYDFENEFGAPRSIIFRKYTISDSLTYRLFGQYHLGTYTRIELEDKGSFFKEEFAQYIVQSYTSEYYNIFLSNQYFFGFTLKAGYTIYKRKEWRHVPVKKRSRNITNEGPYFTISYQQSKRLIFSTHITFSNLRDSRTQSQKYVTGYLRMHYNI